MPEAMAHDVRGAREICPLSPSRRRDPIARRIASIAVLAGLALTPCLTPATVLAPVTPTVHVPPSGVTGHPPTAATVRSGSVPQVAGPSEWPIQATLSLSNDSVTLGVGNLSGRGDFQSVAFDPQTDLLYATTVSGGPVSVIDPSTFTVIGMLGAADVAGNLLYVPPVGAEPGALCIVAGQELLLIDPQTDTLLFNISASAATSAISQTEVYIPGENDVFLLGPLSDVGEVVNLTSRTIVANLSVSDEGGGAAYDTANHELYVGDYLNPALTAYSAYTWAELGSLSLSNDLGEPLLFMNEVSVDPALGQVWASGFTIGYSGGYIGEMAVVNASGLTLETSFDVGQYPGDVVFNNTLGEAFVSDSLAGKLDVIDMATDAAIVSISIPQPVAFLVYPWQPISVSMLGTIYLATGTSGALVAVSMADGDVYASLEPGPQVSAGIYDPDCSCDVFADQDDNLLYFVNVTSLRIQRTVALPGGPRRLAYDGLNHTLWAAMFGVVGTDGVAVTNATTGAMVRVLSDSDPISVTFDPQSNRVFVGNLESNMTVVGGSNYSSLGIVTNTTDAGNALYLPINGGEVVALDSGALWYGANVNLTIIDGQTDRPTNVIVVPDASGALGYDNVSQSLFVAESSKVDVIAAASLVPAAPLDVSAVSSFAFDPESGVAILVNGSNEVFFNASNSTNLTTTAAPNGPALTLWGPGNLFLVASSSNLLFEFAPSPGTYLGNVSLRIAPFVVTEYSAVQFTTTAAGGVLPLNFSYAGLPTGCPSTFAARFACEPSEVGMFPVVGTVRDALGSTVSVTAVLWVLPANPATLYPVTFSEVGLPSGTSWEVIVDGAGQSSSTATISFERPDGTWNFTVEEVPGYFPSPTSGSFEVAGAAVAAATIVWTQVTYPLSFEETGLATGATWSVTVDGTNHSSVTDVVAFSEPNGTFPYAIGAPAGYAARSATGVADVQGSAVEVPIAFNVTYTVSFVETGLTTGTSWSVTVLAVKAVSTATVLTIAEPNGTYRYSIGVPSGYSVNSTSGKVSVRGAASSVSVTFTASPASGPPLGLLLVGVAGAGAAAAAAGAVVYALRRRRRTP